MACIRPYFSKINIFYQRCLKQVGSVPSSTSTSIIPSAKKIFNGIRQINTSIERRIGFLGLSLIFILLAGILHSDNRLVATVISFSFINYFYYIIALLFRQTGSKVFLRDIYPLKVLSIIPILLLYCYFYEGINALSLTIVVVGMTINYLAYWRLGGELTYYGYELGSKLAGEKITQFPYGWFIPHPMIIGAMFACIGSLLNIDFSQDWWWLVVTHMIMYAIVLVMEIKDVELPKELKFASMYNDFIKFYQRKSCMELFYCFNVFLGLFAVCGTLASILALLAWPTSIFYVVIVFFITTLFYSVPRDVAVFVSLVMVAYLPILAYSVLTFGLLSHLLLLVVCIMVQLLVMRLMSQQSYWLHCLREERASYKLLIYSLFLPSLVTAYLLNT